MSTIFAYLSLVARPCNFQMTCRNNQDRNGQVIVVVWKQRRMPSFDHASSRRFQLRLNNDSALPALLSLLPLALLLFAARSLLWVSLFSLLLTLLHSCLGGQQERCISCKEAVGNSQSTPQSKFHVLFWYPVAVWTRTFVPCLLISFWIGSRY